MTSFVIIISCRDKQGTRAYVRSATCKPTLIRPLISFIVLCSLASPPVAYQVIDSRPYEPIQAVQKLEPLNIPVIELKTLKQPQNKPRVVSVAGSDVWYRLRLCESGNNYANKQNPNYRGAYQFSYSTWRSMGGSGDPADAPPAEQDMRAQMLQARSGWGNWPQCAAKLGLI